MVTEAGNLNGIGARLRAARNRAGLSREELAVRSGISWSAIAQVESARRTNLRAGTLAALAGVLGVTIDYLVSGQGPNGAMLEHRALFYEGIEQFLDGAAAFLSEGVERSEAALALVSPEKLDALRERLADCGEHVSFVDYRQWSSPRQAMEGQRAFLKQAIGAGAGWVRILGEPVWEGLSQHEMREWARLESLLNLVFSGAPISILCAYDRASLDAGIIEVACATHMDTVQQQALRPSPTYSDPVTYILEG